MCNPTLNLVDVDFSEDNNNTESEQELDVLEEANAPTFEPYVSDEPHHINQHKLNDLFGSMYLSKKQAELL